MKMMRMMKIILNFLRCLCLLEKEKQEVMKEDYMRWRR